MGSNGNGLGDGLPLLPAAMVGETSRLHSQSVPSRILHDKILAPWRRRNDGVSTCPERFTIRKSAYLQRTPLGRRSGEGRNHGSLHFLVGRRGGQRIADAIPGRCVL